jgi:GNAT superfamily N-acetyltransferase
MPSPAQSSTPRAAGDVVRVERLDTAAATAHLATLCALTEEAVREQAQINFVLPLDDGAVGAYWRRALDDVATQARIVFVALRGEDVVGTVTLAPAPQPNQRHRAEIQKLIVATRARDGGVASALMHAAEAAALATGRWLVTLDTRAESAAEARYVHWGYRAIGRVPDYAVDPDGVTYAPCTFFYKRLDVSGASPRGDGIAAEAAR